MKTTEEHAIDSSKANGKNIEDIYQRIKKSEVKVLGQDGKTHSLPDDSYAFLSGLLAELTASRSVTLLQHNASFTSMEASRLLGMSRQYLVQLLEKGEIPFHKVGTHRRLYVRDVLAYKTKRDSARRNALDDLALAEYKEGIYDKVIPDDSSERQ
jgi:excisionase family DNA binding protein